MKRILRVGAIVVAIAVVAIAGASYAFQEELATTVPESDPPCELGSEIPIGACLAAGTIRYVSLPNLQGAKQFCKWREDNLGEWVRLKTYAETGETVQLNVVTWMGLHVKNDLEAYFAIKAPPFVLLPNPTPGVCK